eukprot:gnl/Chilomastix_cuspidata/1308.p1 GENE.gnl/Chilomastix_cuspidata/1308~~gnl/Chilomastix_cuspidata/1308.p1  ORF type:complete len:1033 (+),score=533.68 gnl/Chilomastix_cuspidata/1308:67-3165(+)
MGKKAHNKKEHSKKTPKSARVRMTKAAMFTNEPQPNPLLYGGDGNPRHRVGRLSISKLITDEPEQLQTYHQALSSSDFSELGKRKKQQKLEKVTMKAKFGTFKGVFGRCLLQIWGVLFFLRLGWVVGECGALAGTGVILLGSLVTVFTSFSLSAISTNGAVRSGGIYFMISRSLGADYGGAVGILFFFANAVATALHISGFSESVYSLLDGVTFVDDERWDQVLLSVALLLVITLVCCFGVRWVVKLDLVFLIVLIVVLLVVLEGIVLEIEPDNTDGLVPIADSASNIKDNLLSSFSSGMSFIPVFARFFPALTGINAGANISGDLRRPGKSIPKGTLLAIAVSSVVYILFIWLLGFVGTRSALQSDMEIMSKIVFWGPSVSIGVITAATSSAFSCLVAAPRVLQALAVDKILFSAGGGKKVMDVMGRPTGPGKEPVVGIVFTAVIAGAALVLGDLNSISDLITVLFLLSYLAINFSCFRAYQARSPAWRPTFKAGNLWTALFGTLLCVTMMILINATIACIAMVVLIVLMALIRRKANKASSNAWGSFNDQILFTEAVKTIKKLQRLEPNVKTFRPQILCVSPATSGLCSSSLVKFATACIQDNGLVIRSNLALGDFQSQIAACNLHRQRVFSEYAHSKFMVLDETAIGSNLRHAFQNLLIGAGLGTLRPNLVMFSFSGALDETADADATPVSDRVSTHRASSLLQARSFLLGRVDSYDFLGMIQDSCRADLGVAVVCGMEHIFSKISPEKYGVAPRIDVYWLADDGGMTLLLPFLLSQSREFGSRIRLRVLVSGLGREVLKQKREVDKLLRLIRISADVEVIPPDVLLGKGVPALPPPRPPTVRPIDDESTASTITLSAASSRPQEPSDSASPQEPSTTSSQIAPAQMATSESTVLGAEEPRGAGSPRRLPPPPAPAASHLTMTVEDASRAKENVRPTVFDIWSIKKTARPQTTDRIRDKWDEKTRQFEALSLVMNNLSRDASFVFVTLPVPHTMVAPEVYTRWIRTLSDIPEVPVVLLRGAQENIFTVE